MPPVARVWVEPRNTPRIHQVPPGLPGAVAAGVLLGEQDRVRRAVVERGRRSTAWPSQTVSKLPAFGAVVHVLHAAEDQEVAGVGGVARHPVQAVAQARVAGALVDLDARLPQPGAGADVDRRPGRPDGADVDGGAPGSASAWPTAPL